MKRRILALAMALAVVCAFGLAGCGGGGGGDSAGTPFDTGKFTVTVADGWSAYPVVDVFSADKAKDPDAVRIGLGATSEADVLKVPYMDIHHYGPDSIMWVTSDFYDDVVDFEPMTIGDRTWKGFTAKSMGYGLTMLYTGEDDGDQFSVTLSQGSGAGNELPDVNDPAVQSMIASTTLDEPAQ